MGPVKPAARSSWISGPMSLGESREVDEIGLGLGEPVLGDRGVLRLVVRKHDLIGWELVGVGLLRETARDVVAVVAVLEENVATFAGFNLASTYFAASCPSVESFVGRRRTLQIAFAGDPVEGRRRERSAASPSARRSCAAASVMRPLRCPITHRTLGSSQAKPAVTIADASRSWSSNVRIARMLVESPTHEVRVVDRLAHAVGELLALPRVVAGKRSGHAQRHRRDVRR